MRKNPTMIWRRKESRIRLFMYRFVCCPQELSFLQCCVCPQAKRFFSPLLLQPLFITQKPISKRRFLDSPSVRVLFLLFSWLNLPPWACLVLDLPLPLGLPCRVIPFACASAFSCVFVCAFVCAYASLCCCLCPCHSICICNSLTTLQPSIKNDVCTLVSTWRR